MKTLLIYPPVADPTAPYVSLPILAGHLRSRGREVALLDANVLGCDWILSRGHLSTLREQLRSRVLTLASMRRRSHTESYEFAMAAQALAECWEVPEHVAWAKDTFRNRNGLFFKPDAYARAVSILDDAWELVGAAHHPLEIGFGTYRRPFLLLSGEEIERDCAPEANPFHEFYGTVLAARVEKENPSVIGISVAFPAQILQAHAIARMVRERFPSVHLTMGGPAVTQILARLDAARQKEFLGPFDTAILYEGEDALAALLSALEAGEQPRGVREGGLRTSLAGLAGPDFEGMPLDRYFSPEVVFPYDASRGCYWSRCAFCHYGLTRMGTAPFRMRPLGEVGAHLKALQEKHGARLVYFSQDAMAPAMAEGIASLVEKDGLDLRWATDMRPEPALAGDLAERMARGGALALSLGVESAHPRVLGLIDKGVTPETLSAVTQNLAKAGIAAEAMCFLGFPGEKAAEALATLEFLDRHAPALFICGQFELVHGSAVALNPERYGLKDIWHVKGDRFALRLFFSTVHAPWTEREQGKVERALDRLSDRWWLHTYPWAGSLSTAHTLLWYRERGVGVFRELARSPRLREWRKGARIDAELAAALDKADGCAESACEREARIWHELVSVRRTVNRQAYETLARGGS